MKNRLPTIIIILFSFALGWWGRGHFVNQYRERTSPVEHSSHSEPVASSNGISPRPRIDNSGPENTQGNSKGNSKGLSQGNSQIALKRLRELLEGRSFDEAILLYEQWVGTDEILSTNMHLLIREFLTRYLDQGAERAFIDLADSYLARYYDDIQVLLIVSEFQRRQGFPDEAARVLQMAATYAYQTDQQQRVGVALQSLVKRTDRFYSQQQRWLELLSFYELLQSISLSQDSFLLRQGILYRQLGELDRARDILLPLLGHDRWGAEVAALLDGMNEEEPEEQVAASSIPVVRVGNHYLVRVGLNNASDVVLMIDTGASVTSLSKTSFEALTSNRFSRRGTRLFNTANGVAKADIYRTEQLSLGDNTLENVDLAVLDFQPREGVDGLLGMNVLQYFHFEIDQDQQRLYLRPR